MALSQILVALALSSAAALTRSPMRMSATATPTHVTTKSDAIMAEAKTVMPGGVSSPVRAFKSVGGDPIVFDSVKGAYAFDVDGNQRGARVRRIRATPASFPPPPDSGDLLRARYVDYVGTWGPAICGHANDEVNEALVECLKKGTSFGAPSANENVLAKMVIDAVPSVEMVRFTNSGTEACMGMLRLVRAYTGREKIIKFEGCYHGHADGFLGTLVAEYNNLESVEALFADHEVAAVVLEPVVGNSGFIPPSKEFLEGIRALTEKNGALLVFDEVMTGFRISYGGAQQHFGVTPDVTTMGKVIGGGLPVGAYGGKKEIMEMVAPAGPMYQAGTLSGNPLAMTAGIKTLEILSRPGQYEKLAALTEKLVEGVLAEGKAAGHAICGGSISGMFGFFFCDGPVANFQEATASDTDKFARWHRAMLERGVYLAPSQYEAGFMSLAHTEEDVEKTIAAAKEVFAII
ncbi:N2-acetyl-L-ornithine:2-oxoglutarate 5-aminotransferase [Aureococcus anophagefferens]|nr:N2-acetyl-L-ornithine:2-oxoglutarate 5-aminotransferase [Aureococcus anophagefferens]